MTREFGGVVTARRTETIINLKFPAIDVVKTRIQIDPALKGHSLLAGGRKIVAAEGPKVDAPRPCIHTENRLLFLCFIGPHDGLWSYSCWVSCPRRREICWL
jgi:hypothetical protein